MHKTLSKFDLFSNCNFLTCNTSAVLSLGAQNHAPFGCGRRPRRLEDSKGVLPSVPDALRPTGALLVSANAMVPGLVPSRDIQFHAPSRPHAPYRSLIGFLRPPSSNRPPGPWRPLALNAPLDSGALLVPGALLVSCMPLAPSPCAL